MKFYILFFTILFLIFGCKDDSVDTEEQEPKEVVGFIYGEKGFDLPPLSPLAADETAQWGVLNDLLDEIKKIYGSDYMNVRTRAENVKEYTDSVVNSIPEGLHTHAINSRVLVLKTRAALLYESSHLGSIDTSQIQKSIRELNRATANLLMQFNEKAQKDRINRERSADEEKERKKISKTRDSIFELERQDMNRQ